MIFDEQKFSSLLGTIDQTQFQIKKISNYAVYFIENANSIVKIYKDFFYYTTSIDTKIAPIYLLNDIFEDSTLKKNNIFVIEFGDILCELFDSLASTIEDIDIIKRLIKIINLWENKMYYSHSFCNKMLVKIKGKENALYEKDPRLRLQESIHKEELNKIIANQYTKKLLEINIEEDNVKKIYEGIDFEKLNNILCSSDHNNVIANNMVKEYEDKLKNFKKILIKDLCKRELFIGEAIDNLNKEKELYFKLEENKK